VRLAPLDGVRSIVTVPCVSMDGLYYFMNCYIYYTTNDLNLHIPILVFYSIIASDRDTVSHLVLALHLSYHYMLNYHSSWCIWWLN